MLPASRPVNAVQKSRGASPEPWGRYGLLPGRSQIPAMLMEANEADPSISINPLSASGPALRA